ncbi:antitoxin [Dactylosporangium darangshiense]|uniref:Antitoxin n=1 Tax=Dactylosporangium darangshiense TaxID=579108 RepID=A0ABP8DV09_9ACTN
MSKLLDKAKELLTKHDDKVDKGLDEAGEQADRRTDSKYTGHIEQGADEAREHTGEDETTK